MIADNVRMEAYVQALRQAVKPGSVVLDIGTGAGIFALLACKFGARRVYAIEPNDAIQVARDIAAANGYAAHIQSIQTSSSQITLPEHVDVIVSDLRGVLPLFQHHVASIADARRRFLAPDGVLIPQCDVLWAAIVEAPGLYSHHMVPWADNDYGLDMQIGRRIVTNSWRKGRVTPEQLLVEPQSWATLDYTRVDSPNLSADVTWPVMRAGTAHGLSVWFDAILAAGVGFSNAPGVPELIYGSAFFPWSRPVALAIGDTVSVALQAILVGEDYVWCWDTRVLDQGDPRQMKANFTQSTFFGQPLSQARLRKQAASHRPTLNEDGQIDRLILELMDHEISLGDIASRVSAQFPARLATWQDALRRVSELSNTYSR